MFTLDCLHNRTSFEPYGCVMVPHALSLLALYVTQKLLKQTAKLGHIKTAFYEKINLQNCSYIRTQL